MTTHQIQLLINAFDKKSNEYEEELRRLRAENEALTVALEAIRDLKNITQYKPNILEMYPDQYLDADGFAPIPSQIKQGLMIASRKADEALTAAREQEAK